VALLLLDVLTKYNAKICSIFPYNKHVVLQSLHK